MAATVLLLSALLLAGGLWWLREEMRVAGEHLNESLAQVIEEQTSRTLQSSDQRLQLTAARLQALAPGRPIDEESARTLLREQLGDLPFLRAIWVVDPTGVLRYDSDAGNVGLRVEDREYFQANVRDSRTGFHLSVPVRSRTTGQWLLSGSRAVRNEDGSLRWVLVAAIEPPYFDRLWRRLDLGGDGAVALFRRDGVLMMRSPAEDAAMGRSFASIKLFDDLRRQRDGTSEVQSALDGRRRVVSYRTLSAYPDFVVTVGRGYDDVLAPWWRFATLASLLWLAAALAVTALSALLVRQLRRREAGKEQFRQLAQAMPQIVFIADARGRLRFVSEQWRETTGVPVEKAMDRGWLQRVHPDDIARVRQSVRDSLAAGTHTPSEQRLLAHDGRWRWHLSRAVAIRDAHGAITAWYGTMTDIDGLKQAQAELQARNELIGMAGRLSRMGGWALELPDNRFIWSDEASDILGIPTSSAPNLEAAIGLCAPESRELATQVAQACIADGTPFDVEVRMLTPEGPIWVRSMGHAVRDERGRIVRMQGALQDVTPRVNAERELREHLATLRRSAEAAQTLMQERTLPGLLDRLAEQSRLVIGAHQAMASLTRTGRAPVVGRSVAPGFEDADHPAQGWLAVPLTERDGAPIGLLQLSDKIEGEFSRHDEYVATELAQLASIAITTLELFEQVRELNAGLEGRITQRTAELRQANAELESFSYSVSHDLRSPLSTIDGFTRRLAKELGPQEGERVRHYLARIQAGVSHMGALIDGLLSLAHVSRMALRRDPVDLSHLATEIIERLQAAEPARNVAWSVEPGLTATGDARLLRAVMENLLGNAWKFSAQVPLAEIAVGWSDLHGAFFVRDNGAGFDMAYAGKLFGTFQRLHDARHYPGTGIGLATVARIISRHGGRIWAQARPGEGATFYFTLAG